MNAPSYVFDETTVAYKWSACFLPRRCLEQTKWRMEKRPLLPERPELHHCSEFQAAVQRLQNRILAHSIQQLPTR